MQDYMQNLLGGSEENHNTLNSAKQEYYTRHLFILWTMPKKLTTLDALQVQYKKCIQSRIT
jgi:hypothetical protein